MRRLFKLVSRERVYVKGWVTEAKNKDTGSVRLLFYAVSATMAI